MNQSSIPWAITNLIVAAALLFARQGRCDKPQEEMKVTARLDEKEVWQVPFVPWQGPDRPSKFDTWLFFHEATTNEE